MFNSATPRTETHPTADFARPPGTRDSDRTVPICQFGAEAGSSWKEALKPDQGSHTPAMRLACGMDIEALVVREGDRVVASGRLVRNRDGDWFEPVLPCTSPPSAAWQVAGPWRGAVRVAGASFDDLVNRVEHHGDVDGYATVTGIWSHDHLRVVHQSAPVRTPHRGPRWDTPPCPAPAGGWPRLDWGSGERNLAFDLGDLADSGAAVAVTTFRPSQDQAVLVVAAADPDAVEAQLRPQLGDLLCVITSRWTRAELDAVRVHLRERRYRWNLYGLGPVTGDDGQGCITAQHQGPTRQGARQFCR